MNKIDEKPTETKVLDLNSNPEEIIAEETTIPKSYEHTENEEKIDVGLIQERRVSQNSELNNDLRDSTPMQTDNEEVKF